MEILNTYIIRNPTFLSLVMWVPIIIGYIIGYIIGFWIAYKESKSIGLGILSGLLISGLGGLIGCLLSVEFGPFTETKRYEVTFNDEIPIVEVMENYNIIEQRGQIFVLEDKEISK